jgi:hypothetical protein
MKHDLIISLLSVGSVVGYLLYKSQQTSKRLQPIPPLIIDIKNKPSTELPYKPYKVRVPSAVTLDPLEDKSKLATLPAPYDITGFGIDINRNRDAISIDDYLNMPLVGDAKTYANTHLAEVSEIVDVSEAPPMKFKYLRFSVLETKGDIDTVHIGHMQFYTQDNKPLRESTITTWNPYTGAKAAYTGPWTNNAERVIIFCFSTPALLADYSIKTAHRPSMYDPDVWTLEGSTNGSFWIPLTHMEGGLPEQRGVWARFTIPKINPYNGYRVVHKLRTP